MVSRRRFLEMGAASGVALGLMPLSAGSARIRLPTSIVSPKIGLDGISQSIFFNYINTSFHLIATGFSPLILRLTHLQDLKLGQTHGATKAMTMESFSLTFQTANANSLGQDTYTLRHASLGDFGIFLVPVSGDGSTFEAVFNRLHV